MAKRAAEDGQHLTSPLKKGERPKSNNAQETSNNVDSDFEDEYEDEFESEDEVFEAGVDGRPDAEREAEEKGTWTMPCL